MGFAFSIKKIESLINEETKNKTIAKFCCQILKTISQQNVSVFCQQILPLQRAKHMLVTFQTTAVVFLLIDFPQKLKLGDTQGILITFFYVSLICKLKRFSYKGLALFTESSDWWNALNPKFSKIPPHKTILESPD